MHRYAVHRRTVSVLIRLGLYVAHVCMCKCMYECSHECMHLCGYVYMYVGTYVRM